MRDFDIEAVFREAAASVVDVFGVRASYVGANGSAEIRGVLSSGHHRVEGVRGPAINSNRVEFAIAAAELGFEPRQGDTVTIACVMYEVATIRPDEEGTQLTLVLKRV